MSAGDVKPEAAANPFDTEVAAHLYADGRPYFHHQVAERIRDLLGITEPVALAVDVGCGTGLSTRALKPLARRVLGTDSSAAMIGVSIPDTQIEYRVAPGEALPVPDASVDLLTISSAFHWLERERFLAEVRRALVPGGAFVIYENDFQGAMADRPDFTAWLHSEHLPRFLTPKRNPRFTSTGDGDPLGFRLIATERYRNDVSMSLPQLVDYLMTQSNVTAALEVGRENIDGVRAWLTSQLTPFYVAEQQTPATLHFGGVIWCLRSDGKLSENTAVS